MGVGDQFRKGIADLFEGLRGIRVAVANEDVTSSREDSRPSWQHYPQDWMADTGLRSVSLAARGLWMDLLCIAWQSPIRGKLLFLKSDNKTLQQVDNKMIARLVGADVSEIEGLMRELADAGVYSVDDSGVIYSRRQLRECTLSQKRSTAGRIGMARRWGNKDITNRNTDNPSSSSSSSTSIKPNISTPLGLSNEPNVSRAQGSTGDAADGVPSAQLAIGIGDFQSSQEPQAGGMDMVQASRGGVGESGHGPAPRRSNGVARERGTSETSGVGGLVGNALAGLSTGPKAAKRRLWKRIEAIQPEGPWLEWWRALLPLIWEHDQALGEFLDAVKHVEDSMNEATRQAKGHGAPKAPERLLVSKVKAVCRRYEIRWPLHPTEAKTKGDH